MHSLKWSFLSELASKAIQPVVFIVLARLLTPEDFGVMSAALMVMGFTQVFWEAGMGQALVQRQVNVDEAANVAFWVNVVLGIIIAILLFLAADSIAQTFFHDSRVTAVIQVMTLQVFLGAVSSVHTALLQKVMGFKKLFWVRFATVSLPGLASIPLALNGMGYWALVAGTLVGQTAQVIMLWRMSQWRPQWSFDTTIAKHMGRFGGWVGASGLLAWFYTWADSLIVGMHLGSHELGLYRTGNQFVVMIFAMLFSPIAPVLYSHFSKIIDASELSRQLKDVVSIVALISIPFSFLIFATSNIIEVLLFGEKWKGIFQIIAIMGLSHGISNIFNTNAEAYKSAGKPEFETYPMLIGLFIFVPVYFISIQYGVMTFLLARLCTVSLFGTVIHSLLAYKAFHIHPWFFLKYVFVFSIFSLALLIGMTLTDKLTLIRATSLLFAILSIIIFYTSAKNRLHALYVKGLQ